MSTVIIRNGRIIDPANKRDLVVLVGEAQPSIGRYHFCRRLLEYAKQLGVERVLTGGYSTAKSMGLGLSGSKRLVDEFTIDSAPGRGTKVTFVKWSPY